MIKKLVLILFISISCKQESKLERISSGYLLRPERMEITNYQIKEWKVGGNRKFIISQGFVGQVNLPTLTRDQLREMRDNIGVNSWVIKISRSKLVGSSETIGYSYLSLEGDTDAFSNKKSSPTFFFMVNYAAASISERIRRLPCPAFNHNKLITDISIKDVPGSLTPFQLGIEQNLNATPAEYVLSPTEFNGGNSLLGNYHVEVALYNFKTKMLKSQFVQLNQVVSVEDEEDVIMKECFNYKIPPKEDDREKRKFKFGK